MQIEDLISPELCLLEEKATSRKKALQIVGQALDAQILQLDAFQIMKALIEREQLGTTAIGNGVALPHGRLNGCEKPVACLLVLENGVDFNAPDTESVDILFCLVVPPEQDFRELVGLTTIQHIFQDKILRAQIRNAHNNTALFDIIVSALKEHKTVINT